MTKLEIKSKILSEYNKGYKRIVIKENSMCGIWGTNSEPSQVALLGGILWTIPTKEIESNEIIIYNFFYTIDELVDLIFKKWNK